MAEMRPWVSRLVENELGLRFSLSTPVLGEGYHGAAYSLFDGRVLKVTIDDEEADCIQELWKLQKRPEWTNLSTTRHFPRIDDVGIKHYGDDIIWWYIREPLEDLDIENFEVTPTELLANLYLAHMAMLPEMTPTREQLETDSTIRRHFLHTIRDLVEIPELEQIVLDVRAELGIRFTDLGFSNWGRRLATGEIVYRDLSCIFD